MMGSGDEKEMLPLVFIETGLPARLLEKVDAYAQQNEITRGEAVRYIIEDWLIGHGMVPLEDEGE